MLWKCQDFRDSYDVVARSQKKYFILKRTSVQASGHSWRYSRNHSFFKVIFKLEFKINIYFHPILWRQFFSGLNCVVRWSQVVGGRYAPHAFFGHGSEYNKILKRTNQTDEMPYTVQFGHFKRWVSTSQSRAKIILISFLCMSIHLTEVCIGCTPLCKKY